MTSPNLPKQSSRTDSRKDSRRQGPFPPPPKQLRLNGWWRRARILYARGCARARPCVGAKLADRAWVPMSVKIEAPRGCRPVRRPARRDPDFQNLPPQLSAARPFDLEVPEPGVARLQAFLPIPPDIIVGELPPLGVDKGRLGHRDTTTTQPDQPRPVSIPPSRASCSAMARPCRPSPVFATRSRQGMGGLMSITGEPGRGPMRVGIPIGRSSVRASSPQQGNLIALFERQSSGPVAHGCRPRLLRHRSSCSIPGRAP